MNLEQLIAERLIKARQDAGLSAVAVAEALGVVRQTYGKFEQAQSVPSVSQLIALCNLFDKPIGYFYEQDDADVRFSLRADSADVLDGRLRGQLSEKLRNIHAIEEAARAAIPEDLPNSLPVFTAHEEDLNDQERLRILCRKAWEIGTASELFIAELLDLDRKGLSVLLAGWYEEQEAGNDAL